MVKAIPSLLVGVVIGAGLMWGVFGTPSPSQPVPMPQPRELTCDTSELKLAQERVAQLESELRVAKAVPLSTQPPGTEPSSHDAPKADPDESLKWKVSAIEKFVPLSDDQRERLRAKFTKEKEDNGEADAESLDDILGAESAAFYREQVQAAFKRVQDEEVEREVVWLSRKLSLSAAQESSVKAILANVEAAVGKDRSHVPSGATPQERVKNMIAENRRRTELRNDQLRQVLTPEQFNTYIQSEAQSSSADVEVFHDAGAAESTPTK